MWLRSRTGEALKPRLTGLSVSLGSVPSDGSNAVRGAPTGSVPSKTFIHSTWLTNLPKHSSSFVQGDLRWPDACELVERRPVSQEPCKTTEEPIPIRHILVSEPQGTGWHHVPNWPYH